MTRKDFQLIADAIADATPLIDIATDPIDGRTMGMMATWVGAVNRMGRHLQKTNPRFDLDRFYKACMVNASWCDLYVLSAEFGRVEFRPSHDPVQA